MARQLSFYKRLLPNQQHAHVMLPRRLNGAFDFGSRRPVRPHGV
jgi:hypothetical protein